MKVLAKRKYQFYNLGIILLSPFFFYSCSEKSLDNYSSESLFIEQISEHCYLHRSYLISSKNDSIPCNGMLVVDNGEVLVFDSPPSEEASTELLNLLEKTWQLKVTGVVANHFHIDCLGGLKSFHNRNIPSYANFKTIELQKDPELESPKNGFTDSLILKVGNEKVLNIFIGPGHSEDNIVSFFAKDSVLFGGCFVKSLKAGKGNLEDANLVEWSKSIEKTKKRFPNLKKVVPGHGKIGGIELLDKTAKMFRLE